MIAKTEDFIRRNLAGQKTKQAKSRRTLLAKLERIDAVRADQSSGDFRLRAIERAGNHVLTVDQATIGYPDYVLARDFNDDGIPDLAVANSGSDDVSVLYGNRDGTFQTQRRFLVGRQPSSVAAGDINGDGIIDLVISDFGDDDISVLQGNKKAY